jgi:hypothetical protein
MLPEVIRKIIFCPCGFFYKFAFVSVIRNSPTRYDIFSMNYELSTSLTKYQRLSTNDSLSAKRAGIYDQNPKKIKKFSQFLTPYFTTSYALHYPLSAICYPLFFVPNTQLRPFIERHCFSVLVRSTEFLFSYSEFSVQCSVFFFLWI